MHGRSIALGQQTLFIGFGLCACLEQRQQLGVVFGALGLVGGQAQAVTVQFAADNIFDVNGRRHASFTMDFVPLVGRNFRASVRLSF